MTNEIEFVYVHFQPPGPSPEDMNSELRELMAHLASSDRLELSRCRIYTEIRRIGDPTSYQTFKIAVMTWLRSQGIDPITCDVTVKGLWADGNPRFDRVMVAWGRQLPRTGQTATPARKPWYKFW